MGPHTFVLKSRFQGVKCLIRIIAISPSSDFFTTATSSFFQTQRSLRLQISILSPSVNRLEVTGLIRESSIGISSSTGLLNPVTFWVPAFISKVIHPAEVNIKGFLGVAIVLPILSTASVIKPPPGKVRKAGRLRGEAYEKL